MSDRPDLLTLRAAPLPSLVKVLADEGDEVTPDRVADLVSLAVDESVRVIRVGSAEETAAATEALRRFLDSPAAAIVEGRAPGPFEPLHGLSAALSAAAMPSGRASSGMVRRSWSGKTEKVVEVLASAPGRQLLRSVLKARLEAKTGRRVEESLLSRMLGDLEASQIVERIPVPGAREVTVHLGPEGLKMLEERAVQLRRDAEARSHRLRSPAAGPADYGPAVRSRRCRDSDKPPATCLAGV